MPRADDLTGFHGSLPERLAVVCTTVFHCVDVFATPYDNNRDAVDLSRIGRRLVNGLARADIDPMRRH
jgi:hypothetical protein